MLFQPITNTDLPEIKNLNPPDWGDILPDIEDYINQPFCYPIKVLVDNKIVGIGASLVFKRTGWLAHIIVHPDYRNRGIGAAIVDQLLEILKKHKVISNLLIASNLGQPVYLKKGFREIDKYIFLEKKDPWPYTSFSENIKPFKPNDLRQVLKLDQFISGEDRHELLSKHFKNTFVYFNKEKIEGYYIPSLKDGPVYADNQEAGLELMKYKYTSADNAVIPEENNYAIEFLKQNGFIDTNNRGTRMILGESIPWQPDKIFGRIGGNYG